MPKDISLLDYFAAKAMQALVKDVVLDQELEDRLVAEGVDVDDFELWTAHVAYGFADAMIEERSRRERMASSRKASK